MRKSKFSEKQIIEILKEIEDGVKSEAEIQIVLVYRRLKKWVQM